MTFHPRVALASLSGASDADWARTGAPYAGAAFLGGIAVCPETRRAARRMIDREREEFLPPNPVEFLGRQLDALADVDVQAGINVRAIDLDRLARVAELCADRGAILEVNAHCRQAEMCDVGAGETLLGETDRLVDQVRAAAESGASVSAKVRAEVPGVDLVETARAIDAAGAEMIHVDAMDSEAVIADVVEAADLFVIANNGVRDRKTVAEYLEYGADAVSVGRPSDRPEVLRRVRRAVEDWEHTHRPSAPGGD